MTWASPGHIPGHREGLLGLVTSLGSSLDARHPPWTSGQLGKAPGPWLGWNQLEKAGEGWTRLLGLPGPGLTLWHTQNTLTHSLAGTFLANPQSAGFFGDFWTFWALHIFWQFWHILGKVTHFVVFTVLQFWQSLVPYWAPKCHRASWGSAVQCKTRDHIERITRTAILDDLPFGAFISQFSCNSCHICKTFHAIHGTMFDDNWQ